MTELCGFQLYVPYTQKSCISNQN